MAAWTAAELYGTPPTEQPTPTPTPTHAPGSPEPSVRTERLPGAFGHLGNPVLVLVVMIGLAILLTQVSVRGSFELGG